MEIISIFCSKFNLQYGYKTKPKSSLLKIMKSHPEILLEFSNNNDIDILTTAINKDIRNAQYIKFKYINKEISNCIINKYKSIYGSTMNKQELYVKMIVDVPALISF